MAKPSKSCSPRAVLSAHLEQAFGALGAQVFVHAALHDAVEALPPLTELVKPRNFVRVRMEVLQRTIGPRVGQAHAVARALIGRGMLRAFIERHDDVGAKRDLHIDGVLRRKEVLRTIEVRSKLDTVGLHLAQCRQRKHLEAAGVGQHGPRPAHEAMHAARALDQLMPRPQVQVVRVGEDDLCAAAIFAECLQRVLRNRLDARGCADGHEHRRLHRTMRQVQRAPAQLVLGCVKLKLQRHPVVDCRDAARMAQTHGGCFASKGHESCTTPFHCSSTSVATLTPAVHAQAPAAQRPTSTPYAGDLSIFEEAGREDRLQIDRVMDILHITRGKAVADIGAGGGWFTVRAARRVGEERTRLRRRHQPGRD